MPFVQRVVEPKHLGRTSLWDEDGKPLVDDGELEAVTNGTLSNALRQLASLVLVADDIFGELGDQLRGIARRSEVLRGKIAAVEGKVAAYDPKKVTVPESDICTFAVLKHHFAANSTPATNLFTAETRPKALQNLYEAATKTPVHLMRQLDRWRRDGHRSSRFFLCTPVLGNKRRRIRSKVDIDIETRMPDAVKELRRWTSSEALGDITVTPDCPNRITNATMTDGEATDGTAVSDDEGIDHKLPSPEEQLQVVALKFPAEIVAVDVSGRSFDRMSVQRRSLLHAEAAAKLDDPSGKRRTRTRRPRSRRRNTLAGTDHKEIRDALTAGEEPCSSANNETESTTLGAVSRSKSSDLLRSSNKKDSPDKKSHFNTLKQWGKTRYDRLMNKTTPDNSKKDIDDFNIYETVTMKRKRGGDKDRRSHERNPSISSSDKSSVNLPVSTPLSSVMSIAVKLRESSAQRRQRRAGGGGKDEPPHSSSGNWSASSESGRASIGSEFTSTTQPKSTTSAATSSNSLNQPPSAGGKRRFPANASTSSEGTLTPDIIHDLHEDGETSSVYSCDTEGYYTSFHVDSGLKTLKEEEMPCTPLHSTTLTAEGEYELFGRGSTSTTTSSAGTVCTTVNGCPAVPERKSSLSKLKDDGSDRTGTVKRSPATKAVKQVDGDVSPDSGHNTSSSPIESASSPNGVRSGSEFEFSESSDMEGTERTERIRVKTTINSSRIPSMCVITPPHSDDESVASCGLNNFDRDRGSKNAERGKLDLNLKTGETSHRNQVQVINVDPKSGYATVEVVTDDNRTTKALRAPSPSGGTMVVNENPLGKSPPSQPIIKATLLPLNSMFGRLKTNLVNLARRDSKSPSRRDDVVDVGDYVTLADVRNNNEEKPEYVCLEELACNERRQGARVTLDAEGKVVYSSDSLRRRKGAHTTFEPGPFVKAAGPSGSPGHRAPRSVRPVNVVVRAAAGATPPPRGAYVHVQEAGEAAPARHPDRAPSDHPAPQYKDMYYADLDQYYFQRGGPAYQTLPSKRTQFFHADVNPERSVTPDITRGLERRPRDAHDNLPQRLGIPVKVPDVSRFQKVPSSSDPDDSRISPIDPRNSGGFRASTPAKELKAAVNLENRLLSPKRSTMSNEELYAVIHKSKKKMNIGADDGRGSPVEAPTPPARSPETGYIGDRSRSRLSWSPTKGEYVDFNADIDKLSPPNGSRSRQSWACGDRKGACQTSRLDFKKLLLQKSNVLAGGAKKLSAVEQLKLSKEQIRRQPALNILELSGSPRSLANRKFNGQGSPRTTPEKAKPAPKLLSPRSQWRFANPRSDVLSSTILEDCREDESPSNSIEKKKSPGGGNQTYASVSQRLQAQRAQFFASGDGRAKSGQFESMQSKEKCSALPTLETAF